MSDEKYDNIIPFPKKPNFVQAPHLCPEMRDKTNNTLFQIKMCLNKIANIEARIRSMREKGLIK